MKHILILSEKELDNILTGKQSSLIRFFKKKPELLKELNVGDIIFFRKSRSEILGQFSIGKLIIIEKPEVKDWQFIKHRDNDFDLNKEKFEKESRENSILVIIQIKNLEQLITSPIEIDKRSKKEWIVLEN